jgi:Ca2+-binding RTX toxin-like protein
MRDKKLTGPVRRWGTAAAGAALAVTALTALPAQAADGTSVFSNGGGLSISARPGIANAITVTLTNSTFTVTDRDLVIVGNGCVSIARNRAECDVLGDDVSIGSGDLDDTVSAPVAVKVSVNAGDGNDTVTTGAGQDVLTGGAGADTLDGGGNNDRFIGGTGADSFHGGAGTDLVDYTNSPAVNVSIDDVANDGTHGEADNVHTDV